MRAWVSRRFFSASAALRFSSPAFNSFCKDLREEKSFIAAHMWHAPCIYELSSPASCAAAGCAQAHLFLAFQIALRVQRGHAASTSTKKNQTKKKNKHNTGCKHALNAGGRRHSFQAGLG